MIDWVLGLWANKWIAFGLYWLPLGFCAIGYFARTWSDVQKDIANRAQAEHIETNPDRAPTVARLSYYHPTVTIGTIIGRGVVSVIPIANFCAAVFDVAPHVFGKLFDWIGRVFDQPLVPKRSDPK